MEIQAAIDKVIAMHDLTGAEMTTVMEQIMSGQATAAQIGGFLIGLRMKGETVEEISAAARVMRQLATPIPVSVTHLVDTCGTGGDASSTFNISTTSAFVAAGAGAKVAKHGNRSVSSQCGSADVLEAAGVRLDLKPDKVAQCIEQVGIGFMFAPNHHGAMKYAIGPRREMGVRTIFNLLGPLTNPASTPNQVVGVFSKGWVEPLARVLDQLGSANVLVVHAEDGLDEISIASPTRVAELRNGRVRSYTLKPEGFGLKRASLDSLRVENVAQSLSLMHRVLDNRSGPALDIVLLNAGAAIYAAGTSADLREGVEMARASIESGAARASLDDLARLSQSF